MSIRIAIDASRNRSGGAKAHLIGILSEIEPEKYSVKEIHVWSYPELLTLIPEKKWLIKHSPKELNKSIFSQLFWQKFTFPKELKEFKCDIVLNTDGGTVCRYQPSVTMSRDMLSYEPGEMDRYKYGKSWFRLLLLKYMQNSSFNAATGVVFLTNYAAHIIQKSCGTLKNIAIIPHGVGSEFSNKNQSVEWPENDDAINCLYVSNTAPYKHQWMVIKAIKFLRNQGYNINLILAGGKGGGHHLVEEAISDCKAEKFVTMLGYVKPANLPEILASSHIFIFASSCENMPNTLVEAMSVGLPIACSNRGPMPEVLEDSGIYFDPENIESIKESIEELLVNESRRKEMTVKTKIKANSYSWKRCANETMEYLVEMLEGVNK